MWILYKLELSFKVHLRNLSRTKSNYWLEQNLFHLFKNIPRTLVHWSYIYWFALCSWKICITQFQKSNAKFFNRTYTVCYVMIYKKLFYYITKKVKRIIFPIKRDKLNILTYGILRWQNSQEFRTYDFGHVFSSITVFSDI